MDKKEITSMEFHFENNEFVEIPFDCFIEFNINNLDTLKTGDEFKYLKCKIEDKGNAKYSYGAFYNITPLQRINLFDDITSIDINYSDKTTLHLYCPWFKYEEGYYIDKNNGYQASKMESSKILELIIDKGEN